MKEFKLISMTDFVSEQKKNGFYGQIEANEILKRIYNYCTFLKQPLTLGMFVPCDEDGNILEKKYIPTSMSFSEDANKHFEQYEKAKENVLFKDARYTDSQKDAILLRNRLSVSPYGLKNERLQLTKFKEGKYCTYLQLFTIQDLIQCDLELTESAIKQIGL